MQRNNLTNTAIYGNIVALKGKNFKGGTNMYEEGKKHLDINWGSLIIKLLIFALVIFLACWIFSKIANSKKTNTKNNGVAQTTTTTKNPEDDFETNLDKMKAVAYEYFTKSRLPEKVGSTEKLTLEEMLDKKLLLDFTDNGKSCDLKDSYIQATRTLEDNYALRVNLTCGKKSDYILANIEKENICANNTCVAKDDNKNNASNNNSANNSSNSNSNSSNSNKNNSSNNNRKTTTTTTTTTITITCSGSCCNTCCSKNCNNNNSNKTDDVKKVRYYEHVKWSDWTEGYSYHSKAENKKETIKTYNYCKPYEKTYYTSGFFTNKYDIRNFSYEFYLDLPSTVNSVKIVNPTYYSSITDYQAFIDNRRDYNMGSPVGRQEIKINNATTFKNASLGKDNFTFSFDKTKYDSAQRTWATEIYVKYNSYNGAKKYTVSDHVGDVIFTPIKFNILYTKADTCKRDLESNSNKYKGYIKIEENVSSKWLHRTPEYVWSKDSNLKGYTKTGNYEDRSV